MKVLVGTFNKEKILVMPSLSTVKLCKGLLTALIPVPMCGGADDQVLDDIYQYHLPPTRRVPPLLWTRLRGDLPGYLADSEADGVIVINWYHRQFRSPTITVRTVGDNCIFVIAGKQPRCDTSPKRISSSISTTSCRNTSWAPTEEAGPSPSSTPRSRDTGAGEGGGC